MSNLTNRSHGIEADICISRSVFYMLRKQLKKGRQRYKQSKALTKALLRSLSLSLSDSYVEGANDTTPELTHRDFLGCGNKRQAEFFTALHRVCVSVCV